MKPSPRSHRRSLTRSGERWWLSGVASILFVNLSDHLSSGMGHDPRLIGEPAGEHGPGEPTSSTRSKEDIMHVLYRADMNSGMELVSWSINTSSAKCRYSWTRDGSALPGAASGKQLASPRHGRCASWWASMLGSAVSRRGCAVSEIRDRPSAQGASARPACAAQIVSPPLLRLNLSHRS